MIQIHNSLNNIRSYSRPFWIFELLGKISSKCGYLQTELFSIPFNCVKLLRGRKGNGIAISKAPTPHTRKNENSVWCVHAAGRRPEFAIDGTAASKRTRGHDERLVASVLSGDGAAEAPCCLRWAAGTARCFEINADGRLCIRGDGASRGTLTYVSVESFFTVHLWWIYQVTNDRKWKSEAYRILSRSNKSLTHILSHTLFLFARLCIHIHDTMRTLRFCLEPSANNIQKR